MKRRLDELPGGVAKTAKAGHQHRLAQARRLFRVVAERNG
jgi:hypothetical protein